MLSNIIRTIIVPAVYCYLRPVDSISEVACVAVFHDDAQTVLV